ncbi:MAG: bifunctional 4-hydroxy-2-oxoglutarate aldolase/2-dehydro-3-deoxy-phosphogluconate aldolase [Lawsonibacter sp.]
MNDMMKKMSLMGVVPVVVLDEVKDAVPLAKAMKAGGIPCAEITLRTQAGLGSIAAMAEMGDADMLVGAGSVITLDNCKDALAAGAKFIVSPGFNAKVVEYCVERDIAVLPGCVTPTEIMEAMELGLDTVKFFPANVYGGLSAMKALSGPFPKMKFIPTGGVNGANLAEYLAAPFIRAVGGSWLCAKADIAAGSFDKITALCKEARQNVLGFEVAHIGINTPDQEASMAICHSLNEAFGLPTKAGNSSNFASSSIEVMNSQYLGANGHIAIRTNSLERAIAELQTRGFQVDPDTAKYQGEKMVAVYLKQEIGGFAFHLLQK